MWAVFKREITSFYLTPIGYVFLGIYLFLGGLFFTMSILPQERNIPPMASYTDTLGTMTFTLLFVIPILTMRLLSEERNSGTDILLFTSPISLGDVVLGKYFAALVEFLFGVLITFIYPLILFYYAKIDLNIVFSGYTGYLLIGAVFISVGMFASSIAKTQLTSAILSFCLLLAIWVMQVLEIMLSLDGNAKKVFESFLILNKYDDFASGLFDIGSVIFYIALTGVFLFLTYRAIEKRRWSEE